MAKGVQKWFDAKLRNSEEVTGGESVDKGTGALGSDLDVDFWGQFLNVDGDEWLQGHFGHGSPTRRLRFIAQSGF